MPPGPAPGHQPEPRVPSPPGLGGPGFDPGREVFERLLERRMVVVSGHLDAELANLVAAQLMLLDGSGDGPIELHLWCPDAELEAGLAVADTIDAVGVPVHALCRGRLGGAALAPLAAARRRIVQPHAVLVLSEPSIEVSGRADDVAISVAAHRAQLAVLQDRLATSSGQTEDRIRTDMAAGVILDAVAAVAYGLVDEVASNRPSAQADSTPLTNT